MFQLCQVQDAKDNLNIYVSSFFGPLIKLYLIFVFQKKFQQKQEWKRAKNSKTNHFAISTNQTANLSWLFSQKVDKDNKKCLIGQWDGHNYNVIVLKGTGLNILVKASFCFKKKKEKQKQKQKEKKKVHKQMRYW